MYTHIVSLHFFFFFVSLRIHLIGVWSDVNRKIFDDSSCEMFHCAYSDSNLKEITWRNVISSAALIEKPYDALCRWRIKYAMQSPLTQFNNRTSVSHYYRFNVVAIIFSIRSRE